MNPRGSGAIGNVTEEKSLNSNKIETLLTIKYEAMRTKLSEYVRRTL